MADNQGSDTYVYAVLPKDEWADLDKLAEEVVRYFFVPLSFQGSMKTRGD